MLLPKRPHQFGVGYAFEGAARIAPGPEPVAGVEARRSSDLDFRDDLGNALLGEDQHPRTNVVVEARPIAEAKFRADARVLFLKLVNRVVSPVRIPIGVFHQTSVSPNCCDDSKAA